MRSAPIAAFSPTFVCLAILLLWAMPPRRGRGRGRRRKPPAGQTGWAAYMTPNEMELAIEKTEQQKRREARHRFEKQKRGVRRLLRRRPRLIHDKRNRRRRRGRGLASTIRIEVVTTICVLLAGIAMGMAGVQPFSIYTDRYLPFTKAQEPAPHPAIAVATDTPTSPPTPPPPTTTFLAVAPTSSPLLPTATPKPRRRQVASAFWTPTPIPPPAPIPTPHPDPSMRYIEAKRAMLDLVNEKRVWAGVPPVALGDNIAAQLHAESALDNCFLSHWGMDGLKPYMRYSVAGGYQSNGENGHGIGYCPKPSERYRSKKLEVAAEGAVEGWMKSPGHRANMLYPHHRKANIGIGWDGLNFQAYLHLEGDHIEYDTLPQIDSDGILMMSGSTRNGATLQDHDDLGVYIYYDPPHHNLTLGQLARTYCYGVGRTVAALREPLTDGVFWTEDEYADSFRDCPNPYDVDPDSSVPSSYKEALDFGGEAHKASESPTPQSVIVPWVTATEWRVTIDSFSVIADLSDVLNAIGAGVYTVTIWGLIGGEPTDISKYSIWYGIDPPDTYQRGVFSSKPKTE